MPLVIYTGIHAMMREPEFQLPAGTQMLTLEALKAESPAAASQPEHSDEAEKTEENQQALLLESLSENVLEGVNQWLKQDAKNKAIIVWPRPVAYIAALLAAGKQTDEALDEWQQLATALLKLFRSHRRQLKLVAAEPGGESPAMDDITLSTLPAPEHSPIYTLAAKQLVDASETLTQAATRLFTSSELAYKTSEALSDQVNSALLHHQQHVQQTAHLQQNLEQLKHQQAEQQAASKKQLDELAKQRDNLKQEKEQQLSALQEENDMVIAELHRVQELLESKLYERDELIKQRDKVIHERNIAVHQRENALQQLDHRLLQLQQLQIDKKQQQTELERFKQALQERDTWNQWLKSNANRFTKAAYRHSRTHRKTLSQQIVLLNTSTHFDSSWYLEQYPDLKKVNINPAEHYLKFGALEGRNPSPHFNTEFYVTQYPDVASSGQNPLLHYLRYGQMEQRKTNYEQLQLPSPQNSGQEATEASSQATQDEEAR